MYGWIPPSCVFSAKKVKEGHPRRFSNLAIWDIYELLGRGECTEHRLLCEVRSSCLIPYIYASLVRNQFVLRKSSTPSSCVRGEYISRESKLHHHSTLFFVLSRYPCVLSLVPFSSVARTKTPSLRLATHYSLEFTTSPTYISLAAQCVALVIIISSSSSHRAVPPCTAVHQRRHRIFRLRQHAKPSGARHRCHRPR